MAFGTFRVPNGERLFAELPEIRDGKRLGWDPHHTDADLRPSIRAGLALDPSRASVRFASYFDDAAVASDAGAKVAHDVWMLAAGRVVSHDGTELSSGDGDILSRDPGWFSIAARLSAHRRLGKIAKSILSRLSRADRAELVARVPATPAAEKPAAKKPAAKKPAAKPAAKRPATKRAGAKTK